MPKFLTFEGVLLGDLESVVSDCSVAGRTVARLSTYHVDADDLAGGLLDLLEAAQEVPEAGLGDDRVRRKDAHAVQAGVRVGLGGQSAAR